MRWWRLVLLGGVIAAGVTIVLRCAPSFRERRLARLSLAELSRLSRQSPDDALVLYYYGEALQRRGKVSDAADAFRRAAAADPQMARARIGLGTTLMRLGRVAEAEAELERARHLSPQNAEVYSALSRIYLSRFDRSRALEALEKAVRLDARQFSYWVQLGQVYFLYARLDDAERCLKRALALRPHDARALLWLGEVYAQKDDTPAHRRLAEEYLRASLRQADPKLSAEAHFELGKLWRRAGRYADAEKALRTSLRLDASRDQTLFLLGQVLLSQGKREEGQRYVESFHRRNADKRALSNLMDAMRADPHNPSLYLRLARLHRRMQNVNAALNAYAMYLAQRPSDRAVAEEFERYRRTNPSARQEAQRP
ncbi:MAG: tetratricopeptide repeat protein [Abditibacteriales bacterium]|nr:tetratricopeptide repeat protein [Abditibacteriales bacterium]MDW8364426.1 tetratricopeptide repeat protein [Abditibacteriales bacterium]